MRIFSLPKNINTHGKTKSRNEKFLGKRCARVDVQTYGITSQRRYLSSILLILLSSSPFLSLTPTVLIFSRHILKPRIPNSTDLYRCAVYLYGRPRDVYNDTLLLRIPSVWRPFDIGEKDLLAAAVTTTGIVHNRVRSSFECSQRFSEMDRDRQPTYIDTSCASPRPRWRCAGGRARRRRRRDCCAPRSDGHQPRKSKAAVEHSATPRQFARVLRLAGIVSRQQRSASTSTAAITRVRTFFVDDF